jgi:hypothetical protein
MGQINGNCFLKVMSILISVYQSIYSIPALKKIQLRWFIAMCRARLQQIAKRLLFHPEMLGKAAYLL